MAENDSGSQQNRTAPEGGSPPGEKESAGELPILPQILLVAQLRLERVSPDLLFKQFDDRLEVLVPVEQLISTCRALRDDLEYRMLMSITAVDWKTSFELVYHLYRLDSPYPVVLRCTLPHEESPQVPSVIGVWRGAEFQEREIYDLMGIVFTGHPDLRRILLADDFQGHPLRKDFRQDPDYVLVPHLRVPGYSGAKRGEASTGRFLSE